MKRIIGCIAAALLATACGAPDFQSGLPTRDMVEVKLPATAQSRDLGLQESEIRSSQAGLAGEGNLSDGWALTVVATATVNGGTIWVLALLDAISEYPPTTVGENAAVWGPWDDENSENSYRLTVTHNGGQSYSYALEAKAKVAAASEFQVILSGSHVAKSRKVGHGELLIDWDRMQTLPSHDDNIGSALVAYGNDGEGGAVGVFARFEGVRDNETGGTLNANYLYAAKPGVGGTFQFGTRKNVNPEAGNTLESFTIESRWLTSGAGRIDAKVGGGDFAANPATVNECWDTQAKSRFLAVSFDPSKNYGTEATDCAIQGAEYSKL
jgi:hypothetical protein